jgi:hypothetical protein
MLDVVLNLKFCWLLEKREIGGKILSFKEFKLYSFLFSISECTDAAIFPGGKCINKQQSSLMFIDLLLFMEFYPLLFMKFYPLLFMKFYPCKQCCGSGVFFTFLGSRMEKNPEPGSGMFELRT